MTRINFPGRSPARLGSKQPESNQQIQNREGNITGISRRALPVAPPMRRSSLLAVLLATVLVVPGVADAHRGSPKKAGEYLARVINGAHGKRVTTGKVIVAGCKAKVGTRRHLHTFTCRVAVRLVTVADGSTVLCHDPSVTVKLEGSGYRVVVASYLNKDAVCGRRTTPTTVPPTVPPAGRPPSGPPPSGPPSGTPPTAPPTGTPPPPPPTMIHPGAVPRAAADSLYLFTGWSSYFHPPGYPDYTFIAGTWKYLGCTNVDYTAFWWWNGSAWVYFAQYWHDYLHNVYASPPC
jgi:hypothetical protein